MKLQLRYAAGALIVLCAFAGEARAQTHFEARYAAKLAGITIGTGVWVVDIADDQYSAAATGRTAGLLRTFAGGEGSGAVRGRLKSGAIISSSYAATISADRKTDEVKINLQNGNVKDVSIEPAPPDNPNRVPVTDADKRGVIDPMTASLVRVAGTDNPVSQAACNTVSSIFDGRMRYDLQMQFKRMENVKAEVGYQGPVVVCGVQFTPIAGHVPTRAAIKYLAAQRNMEVWLAPVGSTRILAPFKVVIPTPLGNGTLEATQFVATGTAHVTPMSVKTP